MATDFRISFPMPMKERCRVLPSREGKSPDGSLVYLEARELENLAENVRTVREPLWGSSTIGGAGALQAQG